MSPQFSKGALTPGPSPNKQERGDFNCDIIYPLISSVII